MNEQDAFSRKLRSVPRSNNMPESASQLIVRERLERRQKKAIRKQRKIMRLIARRAKHLQEVAAPAREQSWIKQKLQKVKAWWRKPLNS